MLKIENIHVQIGKTAVLKNVNLQVNEGEILGIIGPNGCGKTTLLNAVSGFAKITDGSILFKNQDITDWEPFKRAKIGVSRSFQNAGVFREMSVEENLMMAIERTKKLPFWWNFSGGMRRAVEKEVDGLLQIVGLGGHKKTLAGALSGGQVRLLELLRIKVMGGDLLLIDEPTAGVSPAMRNLLADVIRDLFEEKKRSIIVVEHDMKFLFNLVDRVVVLVDGENYLDGKPAEVQADKKLREVYFGSG